jgi:hypothetical protein
MASVRRESMVRGDGLEAAEPRGTSSSAGPRAIGWFGAGLGVSLWMLRAGREPSPPRASTVLDVAFVVALAWTWWTWRRRAAGRSTSLVTLLAGLGAISVAATLVLASLDSLGAADEALGIPVAAAVASTFAVAGVAALVERRRARRTARPESP